MSKYILEISEHQAAVIQSALDLYMRIGMGQYGEILQHSPFFYTGGSANTEKYCAGRDAAEPLLDHVKMLMTDLPSRNSYYSIGSKEISGAYRTACDVRDVIRHFISWDKEPKGGWTVNFDKPFHHNRKEPLAKIGKKDD